MLEKKSLKIIRKLRYFDSENEARNYVDIINDEKLDLGIDRKKQPTENELSWNYKDWSINSLDSLIRYSTNGTNIYGHRFGLIKMAGSCNQDILWISWSTYEPGLERFEGSNVTLNITMDGTQIQLETPIHFFSHKSTFGLQQFYFTNIVANEELISLLKKGEKIEITITKPNQLVEKLDISTDIFSLHGFTAAWLKANDFCANLKNK